jgi:hypothetical protein
MKYVIWFLRFWCAAWMLLNGANHFFFLGGQLDVAVPLIALLV